MACILSKTSILCRAAYYRNIIFGPVVKVTCAKIHGYFSANKSDAATEKRFRLKDNITDDYKLIYRERTSLTRVIAFSYYSAWISLLIGLPIVGYLLFTNPPLKNEEVVGIFGSVVSDSVIGRNLLAVGNLCIPIALISVSMSMPYRIYYSSSQKLYKAIFVKSIRKGSQEVFGEGSAVPIYNRFKSLADSWFKINGRKVLLDRECFAIQAMREKMIYRKK